MAGCAGHEDENATLGTWWKVCGVCCPRCQLAVGVERGTQANGPQSAGGGGEEITASEFGKSWLGKMSHVRWVWL